MATFTRLLFLLGLAQLFTAVAAVVAAFMAVKAANESTRVGEASAEHFRVAERAYVTKTHSPPGVTVGSETITLSEDNIQRVNLSITLVTTNLGNTPARVSAHSAGLVITNQALPPAPVNDPSMASSIGAFLVKEDHFETFRNFPVDLSAWQEIKDGQMALYVIGHVDYTDQFGQRHRSGYGRVYLPSVDKTTRRIKLSVNSIGTAPEWLKRNNLGFVSEPGYNYDRPRQPGEGNDWDEKA